MSTPKTFGWTPPPDIGARVINMATDMYAGNVNATMTLLIMRGLGMGEFEIEQVAKYWMRKGAGEKVIEQMKEGRK